MPGTSTLIRPAAVDPDRARVRIMRVLMLVAAINSIVMTMPGTVITLLADWMTGSQVRAGLAQAMINCGGLLLIPPLTMLTLRYGRRVGIAAGYATGAAGTLLIVAGAALGSFPVLLAGALAVGAASAAGLQSRFAVTDLAEEGRRGRAIGAITWISALGGVLGPTLVGVAGDLPVGGLPPFATPFLVVAVGLSISTAVVAFGLRPDPLRLAKARTATGTPAAGTAAAPAAIAAGTPAASSRFRSIVVALREPRVRRGLLGVIIVQAVMITLMNMAPVHLHHGGATLHVIGLAIGVHVAAMFLPTAVVGWLVDRFGAQRLLVTGLLLELVSALMLATAPAHVPLYVGLGLFVLGLGWSAGFVAGSVMLTTTADPSARVRVQGAADFLMQLVAATGSLLAGTVVERWGYAGLAYGAAVVTAVALFAAVAAASGRAAGSASA